MYSKYWFYDFILWQRPWVMQFYCISCQSYLRVTKTSGKLIEVFFLIKREIEPKKYINKNVLDLTVRQITFVCFLANKVKIFLWKFKERKLQTKKCFYWSRFLSSCILKLTHTCSTHTHSLTHTHEKNTHTPTYTHRHTHSNTHTHFTRIQTFTHTHILTHTHTHTHTHIQAHANTHTYTKNTHSNTHIRTHTFEHTHTLTL